eukprot:scaffold4674_cov188-Amphora_coffeaeformis.AAC.3
MMKDRRNTYTTMARPVMSPQKPIMDRESPMSSHCKDVDQQSSCHSSATSTTCLTNETTRTTTTTAAATATPITPPPISPDYILVKSLKFNSQGTLVIETEYKPLLRKRKAKKTKVSLTEHAMNARIYGNTHHVASNEMKDTSRDKPADNAPAQRRRGTNSNDESRRRHKISDHRTPVEILSSSSPPEEGGSSFSRRLIEETKELQQLQKILTKQERLCRQQQATVSAISNTIHFVQAWDETTISEGLVEDLLGEHQMGNLIRRETQLVQQIKTNKHLMSSIISSM